MKRDFILFTLRETWYLWMISRNLREFTWNVISFHVNYVNSRDFTLFNLHETWYLWMAFHVNCVNFLWNVKSEITFHVNTREFSVKVNWLTHHFSGTQILDPSGIEPHNQPRFQSWTPGWKICHNSVFGTYSVINSQCGNFSAIQILREINFYSTSVAFT